MSTRKTGKGKRTIYTEDAEEPGRLIPTELDEKDYEDLLKSQETTGLTDADIAFYSNLADEE